MGKFGLAPRIRDLRTRLKALNHSEKGASLDRNMRAVFVDRVMRFSLDIDEVTGRTFLSIPVRNQMVEYEEWYEIDKETFEQFLEDPTQAHSMVQQAKARELDHLLLLQPGTDRGSP